MHHFVEAVVVVGLFRQQQRHPQQEGAGVGGGVLDAVLAMAAWDGVDGVGFELRQREGEQREQRERGRERERAESREQRERESERESE